MEADPIGLVGGGNRIFIYVNGNPVNFVDSKGLYAELLGKILEEFVDIGVTGGVGGIYAATCALEFCEKKVVPNRTQITLKCFEIADRKGITGTAYDLSAYIRECDTKCYKITHKEKFKNICEICE